MSVYTVAGDIHHGSFQLSLSLVSLVGFGIVFYCSQLYYGDSTKYPRPAEYI